MPLFKTEAGTTDDGRAEEVDALISIWAALGPAFIFCRPEQMNPMRTSKKPEQIVTHRFFFSESADALSLLIGLPTATSVSSR
jgi:hypothetical protein